jgi:hypothetical protein
MRSLKAEGRRLKSEYRIQNTEVRIKQEVINSGKDYNRRLFKKSAEPVFIG